MMELSPPSKRITVPDVIICVLVGALGAFGGSLWTAIICGCAMAITIAVWRVLWFVGGIFEARPGKTASESYDTE